MLSRNVGLMYDYLSAVDGVELARPEQQVVKLMKGADGAPVELPFGEKEE